MKKQLIMAIDQGTTSSRCLLFDTEGNIVGAAQREFPQIYKQGGWVEQDPMEIWGSQAGVCQEVMAKGHIEKEQILAVGITNQRETTIVWNRLSGKPVYNGIGWQCRRTAEDCDILREKGLEPVIRQKTGLLLDPYFSATKIKWILDHVKGARALAERGDLLFGTVDTWLLWNLTGGKVFATDHTNASRTMLYNIHEQNWDKELLAIFEIPACMLPTVRESSFLYGCTDEAVFGARVPIGSLCGDQQASLFGHLCLRPGDAKNTYGTGCFLLMHTGGEAVESKNGLLTTMAASYGGQTFYALEGSIFIGGAVIQWLRDEMQLIRKAEESEWIAKSVEDTNGVYLVPAFTGLGAPYWDPYARGTIVGLTRGAKKEHIIRAALESMAYQTYDVLKAMEDDSGRKTAVLKVDGGACKNNFLMQFQADVLQANVARPAQTEITALGVAMLAGLSVGVWRSINALQQLGEVKTFCPMIPIDQRDRLVRTWKTAVRRAQGWEKEIR